MFSQRWWFRAVPVLIAINVLIFLGEELLPRRVLNSIIDSFALTASGLAEGRWWQFLTHAFLHGGSPSLFLNLLHLLANMAGLWFAGRIVERVMGTPRFLVLYAVCALAGGLAQVLLVGGRAPLIGASGAVCGLIVAFATMFPEAKIVALLFFVLPLNLRAKYLGWALAISSLFFLVTGLAPHIGHAAHFGGCVAGYLFTRLAGYGEPGFLERRLFRRTGQDTL